MALEIEGDLLHSHPPSPTLGCSCPTVIPENVIFTQRDSALPALLLPSALLSQPQHQAVLGEHCVKYAGWVCHKVPTAALAPTAAQEQLLPGAAWGSLGLHGLRATARCFGTYHVVPFLSKPAPFWPPLVSSCPRVESMGFSHWTLPQQQIPANLSWVAPPPSYWFT